MGTHTTETGEYAAFISLFSQNRNRLFSYIRCLLPNHADAEDVFQRCSLLLWSKFAEYDHDRDFSNWACGVAYYEVRNFLRVAARDRLQFSGELIEQLSQSRRESLAAADHRLVALEKCVQGLKDEDRNLLRAIYDESDSLADYAKAVGRAMQTLYNRLAMLRRKLFECVQHRMAAAGESA